MTDDAVQPAENAEVPAAQQIPITIQPPELPSAAVEARDRLLASIAAEAQVLTAKQSGRGAEALEGLARAYALVVGATVVVQPTSPATRAGRVNFWQGIAVTDESN
ncbi:hypothetical protein [Nocardia terpenica]|uniref:Uncharacterized protein n=1 Tax=Nocardia terpenica TaxID=455432 RepID=A0A6G9Z7D9_9NOCA|nr:hypothetical protein [Nocardia terpenica]QIS21525.1 hypothetical protein F6W96_27505 [Nocardia terpenica]